MTHLPGNVFSIAPGCNFLETLVENLIDGNLVANFKPTDDPLALASATIYVPNRRAARALAGAFIETSGSNATLLPAIRMLGDVGDEDFGFQSSSDDQLVITETISDLERKLQLAKLIECWVDRITKETRELYQDEDIFIPASKADAIRLADDLCKLLNQITLEEVTWEEINAIVPEDRDWAQWWQLTTTFLQIITEHWPRILAERNLVDSAERQALLLERRAELYESRGAMEGPVIIAGSTGSVPATRRLLKVVSKLENGAVVLPGIDKNLDTKHWQRLGTGNLLDDPTLETHPQFGLARLINEIGIDRDNVKEIGNTSGKAKARSRLISLALSPSIAASQWNKQIKEFGAREISVAFDNVCIIDAPTQHQEALAIAIAMREAFQCKACSCVLVATDRNLARRVSSELRRFGLEVDDSAGVPLRSTAAAIFMQNLIEVCFGESGNVAITSLLKNSHIRVGFHKERTQSCAKNFELAVLRGNINPPKIGEFQKAVKHAKKNASKDVHVHSAIRNLTDKDWNNLAKFTDRIDEILLPVTQLDARTTLTHIFDELARIANALTINTEGTSNLYDGIGGKELVTLLEDIATLGTESFSFLITQVADVFDALLGDQIARAGPAANSRLHILGPLEVRLLHYDRVILAGLNEGSWPRQTSNDAFLNRAMRQELNMASPERLVGLAAHDFQQFLGKSEVILSRSQRADKSPTVLSRWLQRVTTLIGVEQSDALLARGARYLQFGKALDEDNSILDRATRPCPKPPLECRPKSLAVSDIELWIRDPYALYAKKILKLSSLPPLERDADSLLRGTLYHAILAEFVTGIDVEAGPAAILSKLENIAKHRISEAALPPELACIWGMRFNEIAPMFVSWEFERNRSNAIVQTYCEVTGSKFLGNLNFKLRATADRIDRLADQSLLIVDYKTGSRPTIKEALSIAPQLTLEAAIALSGGFDGISPGPVSTLEYLRLNRQFKAEKVQQKEKQLSKIINEAECNLKLLIRAYEDPNQGYLSRRAPFKQEDISGDYDHLARTREWSFAGEAADDN